MGKGKTIVTALSGVLVGGLLLTGGMAVAGDSSSSVTDNLTGKLPFFGKAMKNFGGFAGGRGHFMGRNGMLAQETLDQLVKDRVITQAKADEIKAYVDDKKNADNPGKMRGAGMGLLDELVTNKILTQEQADTIQTKVKEIAQEQKQTQLSDSLKALVEEGTITQDQSDKILKGYEDAEKEHESLDQKMEDMTLKEIRQYMADNKGTLTNPVDQLISDKLITQEQADAIQAKMREIAQEQNQQRISDSLKALVDKGTITQEQFDKILKKIEDVQKEREALLEKVKDMTQEERRQYMQDNKGTSLDPISQLVEDGTLTQKQADAIGEVLPFQKGFKGGPGGFKGGFGEGFRGGRH